MLIPHLIHYLGVSIICHEGRGHCTLKGRGVIDQGCQKEVAAVL